MQFSSSITIFKPASASFQLENLNLNPESDKIMAATEELRKLVIRLENVTNQFEGLDLTCLKAGSFETSISSTASSTVASAGGGGGAALQNGGPAADAGSQFVSAFDEIIEGPLAEFSMYARRIESNVLTEQVELVVKAFNLQRAFLLMASQCRPPATQPDLAELLKPTSEALIEVVAVRDKNRQQKEVLNHLNAIGESVGALGWVTIDQELIAREKRAQQKNQQIQRKGDGHIPGSGDWNPAPASLVVEMRNASMFYTNRIIREFKEQDPRHEMWCKAWVKTLTDLEAYTRRFHATGVSWKKFGADTKTFKAPQAGGSKAAPVASAAPPPPPPPAGIPPPPPPPPKELLQQLDLPQPAAGSSSGSGKRDALFASLNQGEAITSSLKKVEANQMTHKNPELRSTSVVNEDELKQQKAKAASSATKKTTTRKAPVLQCEAGKKWVVENFKDTHNVVLDEVTMKQTIYIYNCENSMITVGNKCNSITLDNCKKVAIVFSDIVSSFDVVNCQSVQLQSLGLCPSVMIAKTDGCRVMLNEKSMNAEIVSSKSSEMNIGVPDDENLFLDHPVPEQFKTVWDGNQFKTEMVDIN